MTRDMKTILTRLFTVLMLIFFSMGAEAQVKVLFGEEGTEKFEGKGGTIEVKQEDSKNDKAKITVTLIVTPDDGYKMEKDGLEVYAVISPDGASTRALEISGDALKLDCDDFKDVSQKRTYTVDVDSKLALWVKSANFLSGAKGNGDEPLRGGVTDGIYYITNTDDPGNLPSPNPYGYDRWYLWPSVTTNSSTGKQYVTTYYDAQAAACNESGVSYDAYDNTYSHWVVKNLNDGTGRFQLINPKLNKYIVIRSKANYGDRDVWLDDEPTGNEIVRSYFKLNGTSSPYLISPTINATTNIADATEYTAGKLTLNSAKGNKRYLCSTDNGQNPKNLDQRQGLLQFYDDAPKWTFTENKLQAPTISDVDLVTSKITVTETNGLPSGYNVRYMFSSDGIPADPVATSAIMDADGYQVKEEGTIKVVIERYGVVLTGIQIKTLEPTNKCRQPVIAKGDHVFTITCSYPTTGVTIYYTTDDDITEEQLAADPTTWGTVYPAGGVTFTDYDFTVKAIATAEGYNNSAVATQYIGEDLPGQGTEESPYLIRSDNEFSTFVGSVNSGDGGSKHFKLMADINASGVAQIATPFTGTFEGGTDSDGNVYVISGLRHALFNSLDGGTVKNVMLDNVIISVSSNAGAICNEATGASRIYNCGVLATGSGVQADKDGYTEITTCSSTISGGTYVGGIVGLLDGTSRVINCFSYANIVGGSYVGGIVGWNNVATTSANLATMVMNCMFYGDITGGSSKAPVYNGEIITNRSDENGVSNFNYFWAGASYVQSQDIDVYNCALSAETRYLQRFEFFRPLLNSNRALAAWWATGDRDNKDKMLKWVLEPSQIGTSTPYPILKTFDKYPSVVNIDVNHSAPGSVVVGPKVGKTLSVTINDSSNKPDGAGITTSSLSLEIIDKDPEHFNFNYYKVQLPYYNDVGTGNCTKNKVVTGWKVSVSGGSHNFTTGSEASADVNDDGDITLTTPYNFADRKSTQKDNYDTNGNRIFNQGAYFDVPEGVTSITIEPYWAKCVYVSDQYLDVVYNQTMSNNAVNVTTVGGVQRYANNTAYDINGSSQKVYTSMSAAVTALAPSGTVYDNAIVLVGNVHSLDVSDKTNSKQYTIMSIDMDKDNEPDYSYILRFNGRTRVHPVRIDFLNVIGLGMAQKSSGGTGTYNFGIMQPYGWFEATNTALFRVTQFEYDFGGENTTEGGIGNDLRLNSPIILQGGVIEQWVTVGGREQKFKAANSVTYYHVGGNVWFKEFHLGVHQDKTQNEFVTPHPPISVTGGDYNEFYLTGLYNTPNDNYPDNAECYINGGRFNKVAGTAMQGIGNSGGTGGTYGTGNIIWQIDNADINEFYAGGINAAHIAEGNIYTVITNSRVDQFCGGPKFGDMNHDKIVATNARNCTFRSFFGAGYGGNSYNRRYPENKDNVIDIDWNSWVLKEFTKKYDEKYGGVETRIDYQYIPRSNNTANVGRLFVDYVSFSLATTHNVTSKLTRCTITKSPLGTLDLFEGCIGNFYGGGSLGKVTGPVTSTLIDCTVEGNVFGAGYSATRPTVAVMDNRFQEEPKYDQNLGAYLEAELPSTVPYTWEHAETVNSTETAINPSEQKLYTTVDLDKSNLGSVEGNVNLTITGTSEITGNVYGGGESSYVKGAGNKVTVKLQGNTTVHGNVYGGGDKGLVEGSTEVNIQD